MFKTPKIIAIIIGGIFSIAILVVGFSVIRSGRAEDQAPRDVVVSDITTNSAKISYATGTKTQGVVEYGLTPTALNLLAPESESDTNHEIDLTLLSASTTYYFQISIGGKKYDNAGVPWTFSTNSSDESDFEEVSLTPTTRPTPISRSVIPNPENPCDEVICEKIKLKLGEGCSTQDYTRCIKKQSPTSAPLTTP
ncbi:fibronectin type III domain-containing protein [Candidatus Roizmanbacteria bacterium]|nr:fibronectin type III domain-containing protein [Candidatus Roizmanbacteria bacterium]